ncbi:hypothetical protein BC943DRAFT_318124 [Umbelopsis sp. AD052]|nr:hypothetical protein BC943DRAFT_318124 [Umbelopsis sp. AD052]
MGNSFSSSDLKALIQSDLGVDIAFPLFPVGRSRGSSACCVVDTEWLESIKCAKLSNGQQISVRKPSYLSSRISPADKKHAITVNTANIYISVLKKDPDAGNSTQLYIPVDPTPKADDTSHGPLLSDHILNLLNEPKREDEISLLIDNFQDFTPLEASEEDLSYAERLANLVNTIHHSVCPKSRRYRISSSTEAELDLQLVLDMSDPTHQGGTEEHLPSNAAYSSVPGKAQLDRYHQSTSNLAEVFAIVESDIAYYFIASYKGTTLQDLITYNPGILSSNMKKSFVVYQLLRAIAGLHSRGFVHGALRASNIFIDENLWLQLAGLEFSVNPNNYDIDSMNSSIPKSIRQESLVMRWVRGDISNFTYLMALNHLAGRREGDPNFHPVLPWVTDFSGDAPEDGWRDFTKTKFRLNKGDEQLNFTFDGPVPHHVTDILSDITYYVYLARRTPIPVLCQFVRSKYESNEYPPSIQRLYQWTPDECIPEFYSDPTIFKSIHPDMPDLQTPKWGPTPEEFIKKHAECLESEYVSNRLHTWIDLTFGCNLTGEGAIESKNVALPLLAGQDSFMKHGIIQLFKDKHPQRGCNWHASLQSSTLSPPPSKPVSVQSAADLAKSAEATSPTAPVAKASNPPPNSIGSSAKHLLRETPSPGSQFSRNRAASVNSNTSTDTYHTNKSTNADASLAPLSLNTDPILLPPNMGEDVFTEQLVHFEETHKFGAKYLAMNEVELVKNPYLSDPGVRYKIDAYNDDPIRNHPFAIAAADDMRNLGAIIQGIYTAGSAKIVDLDGDFMETTISGLFETGGGYMAYDIAPSGKISIPPVVSQVITSLTQEDWYKRPSAKAVLYTSFPMMTIHHPNATLPFQQYIYEMYEYLAGFHLSEWSRRLYLADKWVDWICDLDDEVFDLILPTFIQLMGHRETRLGVLSLFPKIAQKLGPEKTKRHLLKPIVSILETTRPKIPAPLLEYDTLKEFIRRLGVLTFLQQLLPCYLESVSVADDAPRNTKSDYDSDGYSAPPDLVAVVNKSRESSNDAAGKALVHICSLIGPVLTSKHVMRQLFKIIFRDYRPQSSLQHAVITICGNFGESFSAIQFAYLASIIDTYRKNTNKRNSRIICSILTLLEQLTPNLSNERLLTELKSGFISTLYQLIEPISPNQNVSHGSKTELRLKLTISMRTIDFLLNVTNHITRADWEDIIGPLLQQYFSNFTPDSVKHEEEPSKSLEAQQNYQMVYAYSHFCLFVGQETMRRVISTSASLESMMYDHFSSNESTPLPTTPFSPGGRVLPNRKEDVPSPAVEDEPQGFLAWVKRGNRRSTQGKDKFSDIEYFSLGSSLSVDFTKLYNYSTKDLFSFTTSTFKGSRFSPTSHGTIADPQGNKQGATVYLPSDKEKLLSKTSVVNSVLPWKTKWKPVPEDIKNWNRFLLTNSEEMSKSMQFSFNDLKLRGFAGHTSAVRTFGINESASIFGSGSRDRTVKLWSLDVCSGIENWRVDPFSECLISYNGHRRTTISDVHFLTGGGSSGVSDVVASCDGQVHLWEPETAKTIHQFNIGKANMVSVSPIFRSRCLVGGNSDGTIMVLDAKMHTLLHTWKSSSGNSGTLKVIAVNTSETLIAVGFSSGVISLLESRTGSLVASWKGGDSDVTSMKFYTNELLVSCAPADHTVCFWNVSRLSLVKTVPVQSDFISLDLFKDEIIAINNNNSVSFIPLNEDFQPYTSKFKTSIVKSQITSFGVVPVNQLLLFGCGEGEIYLYA